VAEATPLQTIANKINNIDLPLPYEYFYFKDNIDEKRFVISLFRVCCSLPHEISVSSA